MPVHQQFKADLDVKPYEAGLHRMENATRTSTTRVSREMDRVQASTNRMSSSMGARGGNAMSRVGGVSMQLQDIAVQMQAGQRASIIMAQQGSQIASMFGPGGMVVGGMIAIAALFLDSAQSAERIKKEMAEVARQKRPAIHDALIGRAKEHFEAANLARIQADEGERAAEAAKRELDYQRELDKIRKNKDLTDEDKNFEAGALALRKEMEDRARNKAERRAMREGMVEEGGEAIRGRADQIRGKAPSKAEVRREKRAQENAERRAISERIDEADRKARNTKDGTNFGKMTGLTQKEKDAMREGKRDAVKAAKDEKVMAAFSDEQLVKIVNSIEGLLAK